MHHTVRDCWPNSSSREAGSWFPRRVRMSLKQITWMRMVLESQRVGWLAKKIYIYPEHGSVFNFAQSHGKSLLGITELHILRETSSLHSECEILGDINWSFTNVWKQRKLETLRITKQATEHHPTISLPLLPLKQQLRGPGQEPRYCEGSAALLQPKLFLIRALGGWIKEKQKGHLRRLEKKGGHMEVGRV